MAADKMPTTNFEQLMADSEKIGATKDSDRTNAQNQQRPIATAREPVAGSQKESENKRNSIIKMAGGTDLDLDGSDAEDTFVFRTATTRASPTPNKVDLRGHLAIIQGELSQCSTTSDINSDDDAVSLASRLSQIVFEEESKEAAMSNEDNSNNNNDTSLSSDGNFELDNHDLNTYDCTTGGKMRGRSSTFKLEQQEDFPRASDLIPEIQVTKCQHHELYQEQPQQLSNQQKLPDSQSTMKNQLVDLPQLQINKSRNNERSMPERGNIKNLESSRQQQYHQLSGDVCNRRPRSNTTLETVSGANTPGPNSPSSLQSNDDLSMLNIRRSTWTLSEFDDTYNKFSCSDPMVKKKSPLEHASSNPSLCGGLTRGICDDCACKSNDSLCNKNHSASNSNLNISTNFQDPLQLRLKTTGCVCNCNLSSYNQLDSSADSSSVGDLLAKVSSINSTSTNHQLSGNNNNNRSCRCLKQQYQQLYPNQVSPNPNAPFNSDKERRVSFTNSMVSLATSIETNIITPVLARRPPWSKKSSKKKNKNNRGDIEESSRGGSRAWNGGGLSGSDGDDDGKRGTNSGICERWFIWSWISNYVPIFEWLPNYSSSYIYGDLMAGLAVAVLNISTSLSAAVVAETNLGVAFKTSIVNTFFYAILCSSRHTSFGSYSIMSQMLLVSVQRALSDELILSRLNLGPTAHWKPHEYERWHLNIIVMFTFLIGAMQLVCGLLKLGYIVASFIPEALSSSMIAATAFTMAIGQLANMCGTSNKILWSIEKNTTVLWADLKDSPVDITDLFANLFRWIQQIALLIRYYDQINPTCVIISMTSVTILCLNQYFIQKQLKLYFKRDILIPIEMILLIIMILVSYTMDLAVNHQVPTCGPIEIDLQVPNLPDLRLIRELWFQSLATALISYTTVHIMSKTYSNKLNYEVDTNQELIACGAGNLIGGLVDAMPAAASFSRTAGQVEAGGQTQMASIVNCVVLLLITYCLGQHVAALPVSVMAATLFYGFLRMMSKMMDVFKYWRVCKVDFSIWVVSFFAILATDLVTGFVYGFIFSIITLLYRAQNRRCYMLGIIPSSPDVFVPLVKYPMASEIDGIKIFQYCGPINYVSEDLFERLLRAKTRVNVKQIIKENEGRDMSSCDWCNNQLPSHIILDFSMISFIDSSGLNIIKKIIEDYQRVNVTILIASMASHVAKIVKKDFILWSTYKQRFYVTLSDAVHNAARSNRLIHQCNQAMINYNHNMTSNESSLSSTTTTDLPTPATITTTTKSHHKQQEAQVGQRLMMLNKSNNKDTSEFNRQTSKNCYKHS